MNKLNNHIREKHLPDSDPRRFFTCKQCDGKFRTSHQLDDHMALHKPKTATFTCDYCERVYNTRKYIVQHMEIMHSKAKNTHPCSVCSKVFRDALTRDDHENTHTGRKPHQCTFCPKEFMNIVTLRRHTKSHGDDGMAPLPAIVTYECSACPKVFRRLKERDNHLNSHTGVRPYQCQHCPKGFLNLRHLNRHTNKMHADESGWTEGENNGDKGIRKDEPIMDYLA